MTATKPPLKDYERNDTSQYGEDGVIERALAVIGDRSGWCVEFGASDGVYLSNTHRLINREGFSAVLIEASDTAVALQKRYEGRSDIFVFNPVVEFEGPIHLDACFASTPIVPEFDVLSIDIDGNDYHIWDSLRIKAESCRHRVQHGDPCRGRFCPAQRHVDHAGFLAPPGMVRLGEQRGIDSSTLQSRMQYSSMRSTIPGSASPTALRLLSGRSVLSSPTFFSFMMGRFVLRGARS